MSGLDGANIQRFLATRYVVVLATVQADGAPLAMPMWFLHDPASVTMLSVEDTQKVRNLRRDPRVSVIAETAGPEGGDVRGVIVQGRAEFLLAPHASWRALVVAYGAAPVEVPMPASPSLCANPSVKARHWAWALPTTCKRSSHRGSTLVMSRVYPPARRSPRKTSAERTLVGSSHPRNSCKQCQTRKQIARTSSWSS